MRAPTPDGTSRREIGRRDQQGGLMNERDIVKRDEKDLVGLCQEARRGGITRRQFVERALVMGLSASAVGALAGACGTKATETNTNTLPPMDETKPSELVFYNWTDYFNPALKKKFLKETGIKIKESYFSSNEELLAKLKAGAKGYDIIVPSDYMVHIMIKSGIMEPLDMKYLPNFQYVGEQFKAPTFDDPEENNGLKYSVPYFYGTTGYSQRMDKVTTPQTSWAPLWDEQYKGKINLLDDEREDLGMALKKLGFSSNTLVQEELDQAMQELITQKPLVAAYDSVNMKRAMVQGQSFVMCWDGDVLMGIDTLGGDAAAKKLLHYVLPEEGFCLWTDGMGIPVGANSRFGAHTFMNWLMDPKIAGENADWVWYLSAIIPASWDYTDPFALTLAPTDTQLAVAEAFDDVGEFATAYSDAWRQVKSA
jgi:spermidine/putrescine transport system substrate-binding protein